MLVMWFKRKKLKCSKFNIDDVAPFSRMESKLARSLERFRERIANGSYYEAQQTIRSITNRYVHGKQYDMAISLLYQSIIILIENKQFDESADLYLYLLEVFGEEGKDWESFEKDGLVKIINLIKMLPSSDVNLLNLSRETSKFIVSKSGKVNGDERVNYLFGEKMIKSGDVGVVNQGEKMLITSNESAVEMLVEFEWKCYLQNGGFNGYLLRSVLPILMTKNVKFAKGVMDALVGKYIEEQGLEVEEVEGLKIVKEGEEIINFLQLLVLVLGRFNKEDSNAFTMLLKRYNGKIHEEGIFERVNDLAIEYYGISFIKKQSNLLQDMMGSFLK